MERFLSLRYYFAPLPSYDFNYTKITFAVGLLLLVVGLLSGYYRKKMLKDKVARKILKPYPAKLTKYGFIVWFLLLVREQGIPYLSMRLWWFVLLGFFLYHFIKLAMTYKSQYAARSKKKTHNSKNRKYLPKKKK